MNHGKNVGFNFSRYGCAHKSGGVESFTIGARRISSRLRQYKNYKKTVKICQSYSQKNCHVFCGSLCI